MARRARDPQQSYNYHISEIRAYMSDAPKSPWIVPMRALDGQIKDLWDKASVERRSYLPYNDIDATGQPVNAPQRTPVSTNLANLIQGAQQSLTDIQASLGMYQANLGAPSNETSGIAIESRKQQGEASTSHFQTHAAASIAQVGRLIVDMIPRLIDTRRRMRILGIDMTPGAVMVDPQAPQPLQQGDGITVINPSAGHYDVRVVVGASYSTQRQQAQEAYTEMMRANPALTPALGPLWAQTLDVPHADKLAQVLTAMAPPEVREILQPKDGQPSAEQLQAQMQQMQQALQEAVSLAQEAQQELQEAKSEAEDKRAETHIKAYEAATNRLKVTGANEQQVQAIVMQLLGDMARTAMPPETQEPPEQNEAPEQMMPAMGGGEM
jgi:hypothetical protein